jgi:hypothetical protein
MFFLWITKKLFEKTSGSKQNQLRYYLFYGQPEKCVKIETGLARFPMHVYVASTKHVADGTRFLTKITLNNVPLVM